MTSIKGFNTPAAKTPLPTCSRKWRRVHPSVYFNKRMPYAPFSGGSTKRCPLISRISYRLLQEPAGSLNLKSPTRLPGRHPAPPSRGRTPSTIQKLHLFRSSSPVRSHHYIL